MQCECYRGMSSSLFPNCLPGDAPLAVVDGGARMKTWAQIRAARRPPVVVDYDGGPAGVVLSDPKKLQLLKKNSPLVQMVELIDAEQRLPAIKMGDQAMKKAKKTADPSLRAWICSRRRSATASCRSLRRRCRRRSGRRGRWWRTRTWRARGTFSARPSQCTLPLVGQV